jgi:hypothetical protein
MGGGGGWRERRRNGDVVKKILFISSKGWREAEIHPSPLTTSTLS